MTIPSYSSEAEHNVGPIGVARSHGAERRASHELGSANSDQIMPSSEDVKRTTQLNFILLFALLLTIFIVFIPADRLLLDPDLYWHTATGRFIWTTKSLPVVDEFSHTFRGHPWIARDWLSDVAMYGSYSLDDWRGVSILAAISIALAYGLLFLMLARTMRLTVALGVAVVMACLSFSHLHARTQLLADGLIVIWVAGLVRAVDTKTSPSWWLLPVMALWANVHGGFIVGLALAVGLAIEAIVEGPRGERGGLARRWTFFLVVAIGASCLTPYGGGPLLLTLKGLISENEVKQYVLEWQPVSLVSAPITLIFVLIAMFAALLAGVKIRLPRLVLVMAITSVMFSAVRYSGPYNLVIPLLLATPLCAQFPVLRLTSQIETQPQVFILSARAAQHALYPLYAVILLVPFAAGAFGAAITPDSKITPSAAVDYIIDHKDNGKVYNSFDFGGYLIFRRVPTFVDGRTDQLFLAGFSNRINDITKHPRKIARYLDEYDIGLAILKPDSSESEELQATPGWDKVYSDKFSTLFKREL